MLPTLIEQRFLVEATADERGEFIHQIRPDAPETGAHLQGHLLLAAEQCNLVCPYCIKAKLLTVP